MLGFAHKCLVLLSLAVFCFAIHPDTLNLAPPPGRMRVLPTRTLRVWERPEDLRSIDPRATGESEAKRLLAFGGADEYLGSQVVDYANSHPSDPDVPIALYLAPRAIRYGCYHE
jgi:hypothetical protein